MTPDFNAHRQALLERLQPDEALLVFAGATHLRNGDADYRYRPDSNLYWLTGWTDPEAVVFIRPGKAPFTLFVQAKDPARETWDGFRHGPEGAIEHFAANNAFEITELAQQLPGLLTGVRALHYDIGKNTKNDQLVLGAIAKATRASKRNGLPSPQTFHHLSKLLHELRLRKLPDEIELLKQAGDLGARAHLAAMAACTPNMFEFELEAMILNEFLKNGSNGPGYTSIVAAGKNATILHYVTNREQIQDGDLVLIDAGCEMAYYTSDITRTFPANGHFTAPQRAVYDVVLRAQRAAIEACTVNSSFIEIDDLAARVLTEGMVELGLLEGDVSELMNQKAHKKYYMHGTSHWLGLDVHDVGSYGEGGRSRALKAGMVLTIEPGLYISKDDEDAPKELRGIGIRIEDDILVTAQGPVNLTAAVPTDADEIEAVCQGKRPTV